MKLHIISTFHYDYIYLQDSESYFEISFRILDKALDILEKEQDWCFCIEQTILVEEYLRRFPEKKGLMQNFVQEGRLAFAPGMYVMPDMNMVDVESLCL
ncbi:MAG: alpha-mannosidase, partial [Lentisphaeria bacterium]|nr:alpha-mannosidase [Lentisphaeria bacterium]